MLVNSYPFLGSLETSKNIYKKIRTIYIH